MPARQSHCVPLTANRTDPDFFKDILEPKCKYPFKINPWGTRHYPPKDWYVQPQKKIAKLPKKKRAKHSLGISPEEIEDASDAVLKSLEFTDFGGSSVVPKFLNKLSQDGCCLLKDSAVFPGIAKFLSQLGLKSQSEFDDELVAAIKLVAAQKEIMPIFQQFDNPHPELSGRSQFTLGKLDAFVLLVRDQEKNKTSAKYRKLARAYDVIQTLIAIVKYK